MFMSVHIELKICCMDIISLVMLMSMCMELNIC